MTVRLLDGARGHPENFKVSFEKVRADPVHQSDGKKRWRVCFTEQGLDRGDLRVIAMREGEVGCFCFRNLSEWPAFSVELHEIRQVVRLNAMSVKQRFRVTDRLLWEASLADDLGRVVCLKWLENNPKMASEIVKRVAPDGKNLHLSRKDFQIHESIYTTHDGFMAYGVRGQLGKGSFSCVKKARTLDGEILARRICRIGTEKREQQARRMIEVLRRFNGRDGIIDLRAVFEYRNQTGLKIVTFHSLYERNFLDLLSGSTRISEEDKLNYAEQLFTVLQAIKGAHSDLKPDNIVIQGKKLALIDLEFFQEKGTVKPRYCGTRGWAAPEIFSGETTSIEKIDVWALGIILFYLFDYPNRSWFRPHCTRPTPENPPLIYQGSIDGLLNVAAISKEKKELLFHMIVIDPQKRWTIDESAAHFRTHVLKRPQEEMKS